jgi:hypothetical protein
VKTLCGIVVVGLVLLGIAASYAGAKDRGPSDGNELLTSCRAFLAMFEAGERTEQNFSKRDLDNLVFGGLCGGVIEGIFATQMSIQFAPGTSQQRLLFCVPDEGVRPSQATRIIIRYLEMWPQKLHFRGSLLAVEAISDAFPCPPAVSRPPR